MPRNDINFNSGFTGCNDRMAILKNETVPRRLDEFEEVESPEITTDMYVYVDDGKSKKVKLGNIVNTNGVQSDWDEENEGSYAYIKNKPDAYLKEDITALYQVGGIRVGQTFDKGTSLYDIIFDMLSTSKEASMMFGLVDNIPAVWTISDIDALQTEIQGSISNFMLYGTDPNDTTFNANNQFYVLAVPKFFEFEDGTRVSLDVSEILQNGFSLDFVKLDGSYNHSVPSRLDDSIKDQWDIYLPVVSVFDTPVEFARTTGEFTVIYKFKRSN